MSVLALSVVIGVLMFSLLALFARGGGGEPVHEGLLATSPPLGAEDLQSTVRDLLAHEGFVVDRYEEDDGRSAGFIATDPRPFVGQRVYVRAFALPPRQLVTEVDVQSALDSVHGEGLSKAILISSTGFSDEAILAARDMPVELLNEDELLAMSDAKPLRLGAAERSSS